MRELGVKNFAFFLSGVVLDCHFRALVGNVRVGLRSSPGMTRFRKPGFSA